MIKTEKKITGKNISPYFKVQRFESIFLRADDVFKRNKMYEKKYR